MSTAGKTKERCVKFYHFYYEIKFHLLVKIYTLINEWDSAKG